MACLKIIEINCRLQLLVEFIQTQKKYISKEIHFFDFFGVCSTPKLSKYVTLLHWYTKLSNELPLVCTHPDLLHIDYFETLLNLYFFDNIFVPRC